MELGLKERSQVQTLIVVIGTDIHVMAAKTFVSKQFAPRKTTYRESLIEFT